MTIVDFLHAVGGVSSVAAFAVLHRCLSGMWRLDAFWAGAILSASLTLLAQYCYGQEGYLALVRDHWVTGWYSVPVAIAAIVWGFAWKRSDVQPPIRQPRAMVLQYQPELTHSVWVDYFTDEPELLEQELRDGVRAGKWVGWRVMRVENEVMGNEEHQ